MCRSGNGTMDVERWRMSMKVGMSWCNDVAEVMAGVHQIGDELVM